MTDAGEVPIGRSASDGLDYPINPRFDNDGRWRRRPEWPEELR
jgi:palmitoyltransferase